MSGIGMNPRGGIVAVSSGAKKRLRLVFRKHDYRGMDSDRPREVNGPTFSDIHPIILQKTDVRD